MRSALIEMRKRHEFEEDELRKYCKHPKGKIKIHLDSSCVGAGSLYPRVDVVCRNCGKMKYIFDLSPEQRKRVKRQVTWQGGFKDERCHGVAQHEWELTGHSDRL